MNRRRPKLLTLPVRPANAILFDVFRACVHEVRNFATVLGAFADRDADAGWVDDARFLAGVLSDAADQAIARAEERFACGGGALQ